MGKKTNDPNIYYTTLGNSIDEFQPPHWRRIKKYPLASEVIMMSLGWNSRDVSSDDRQIGWQLHWPLFCAFLSTQEW